MSARAKRAKRARRQAHTKRPPEPPMPRCACGGRFRPDAGEAVRDVRCDRCGRTPAEVVTELAQDQHLPQTGPPVLSDPQMRALAALEAEWAMCPSYDVQVDGGVRPNPFAVMRSVCRACGGQVPEPKPTGLVTQRPMVFCPLRTSLLMDRARVRALMGQEPPERPGVRETPTGLLVRE